jgi:D-alanyl-D-alanine carboxypeptidase
METSDMIELPFLVARIDAGGEEDPETDRELVPWWSLTKTALAVAALKLVECGDCKLDECLDGRSFTLRQLLQHRAGVPNYGALGAYHEAVSRRDTPWSVRELLSRVDADRLEFKPGTSWSYSNVGYLYVRQLVEQLTGRSLNEALRDLILDDLGLPSVMIAESASDLANTAWGNTAGYDPRWVYHGLLIGTPRDAARFFDRLMSGHVLSAGLLAEMTSPYPLGDEPLPGRPWTTTGYGMGLMIGQMAPAGIAIGHSGGGPGSVAAAYHFPDGPTRCTIATFAPGPDEGRPEFEARRLALSPCSSGNWAKSKVSHRD